MRIKFLIIFTIVLSFCLRFYNIGINPPSLYWDEASLGWNAYKLLETGRDEYGIAHPLVLKSFGDYKPALLAYLMIFPIKIFGLNAFSVRIASVLIGSLLPLAIFLLVKKITHRQKIALIASFLTAINPWMLQMSRAAFEANLGLNLMLWGVIVIFYSKHFLLKSVGIILVLSSVYAYHANKFFAPVVIILYFLKYIIKNRTKKIPTLFLYISLSIIVLAPLARSFLLGYGFVRFTSVSSGSVDYLANILSHFNFDFLFLNADLNLRHHVLGYGLFYIFESIFLFFGLFIAIAKLKERWWVLTLMILSMIPSAVSQDAPHAIRSILSFPFFILLISLGLSFFSQNIKMKFLILIAYSFILISFFNARFIHYPSEAAASWQYGYREVAKYLFEEQSYNKYDRIIMTTAYDEPYISMLFYSKGKFKNYINPGNAKDQFGKFEFKKINFEEEKNKKNTLIIGTGDEIKQDKVLKTIYYPDGKVAFQIVASSK
jgi:4-amino-4-deoxy-L-arabinose transferase-like glycosyltransferase